MYLSSVAVSLTIPQLCIGDSFNMRHPLTGGGMTVALNDVVIVRDILARVPNLSDRFGPLVRCILF